MINLQQIKAFYQLSRDLSFQDIQVLLKAAQNQSYIAGEILIPEGTFKKDLFFIKKGLVRAFVINKKGDEITTLLRWEHQLVASLDNIFLDKAATHTYQALEPTQVLHLPYDSLQNILAQHPKLEANRKFFFQKHLEEASKKINSFILLSPEERYLELVDSNPSLVNRVPDKHIAHILGITPVSLSRIRKRLASKKK